MTFPKGRHPGATWRKTDLQVHTPRDRQWSGSPNLPGGDNSILDAKRYDWAKKLLDACIEKTIEAIAITDHHDTCFIDYVRKLASEDEKYASICVFPGMEITCDDDAQCLVLFDTDTPIEKVNRLFGILPQIDRPDHSLKVAPQAESCGLTIADFCNKQSEDSISRVSIVLPHGGKSSAHKTLLKNRQHKRFKKIDPVGLYCEHLFEDFQPTDINKFNGTNKEWTDYRKGVISTGDNRDASFTRLGAHPCWIKLGETSAEAIRQALLVDQSRISYEQPISPQHQLVGLRVSSTLCGENFYVSFNDGLTTFIGGRGSGKSALLEYLRFGLGRSSLDIDIESDRIQRNRELLRDTLQDGFVEVELLRNQVPEIWRRDLDTIDSISVTTGSDETESLLVHEVRDRFRARAFEQGQLSSLVTGDEEPENQITSVAAAEHVEQRREIDAQLRSICEEIEDLVSNLYDVWMLNRQVNLTKSLHKDLKRQLEAISKQLTVKGLSAETQKIIEAFNHSRSALEHIKDRRTDLINIRGNVNSIEDELQRLTSRIDPQIASYEQVKIVEELGTKTQEAINAKIKDIDLLFANAIDQVSSAFETQTKNHQEISQEHEKAKEQQASFKKLIEEKSALDEAIYKNEARLKNLEFELNSYQNVDKKLNVAKSQLWQLTLDKKKVLEDAANKVTSLSLGSLRATVKNESLPTSMIDAIEAISVGCNIRDARTRAQKTVERVCSTDEEISWEHICEHIMELAQYAANFKQMDSEDVSVDLEKVRQHTGKIWGPLSDKQMKSILDSISEEHLANALCAGAEPFINFEYQDHKDYIDFHKASPGQQAAAILRLLLHQEAGTLIIDQPEDDLDNKVIADIADEIQLAKRQRQIVFATHNPNLVVNGDADKIVALGLEAAKIEEDTPRINILTDGAIETPSVAQSITEIMEGGIQAFELRRRKYEFL